MRAPTVMPLFETTGTPKHPKEHPSIQGQVGMGGVSPPHLLNLPTELLVSILVELGIKDILAFRTLSQCSSKIVSESLLLQYRIELAIAGYIDNQSSTMTTAEKLAKLRSLQSNWRSVSYTAKAVIPLPRFTTFEYNGGMFASANTGKPLVGAESGTAADYPPPTAMCLIDLPSRISGRPDACSRAELEVKEGFIDFTVDAAQDLLILVQGRAEGEFESHTDPPICSTFHILFRTLSTSMPHPEAKDPLVVYNSPLPVEDDLIVQIMGDRVAILFGDCLEIWNWKTGCVIGEIRCFTDTFSFVAIDLILTMNSLQPSVHLFALPDQENVGKNGLRPQCRGLAIFDLPSIRSSWSLTGGSCRSDPMPGAADLGTPAKGHDVADCYPLASAAPRVDTSSPLRTQKPFRADPSKRIVCINLNYTNLGDTDGDTITEWGLAMITLNSTFIRYAAERRSLDNRRRSKPNGSRDTSNPSSQTSGATSHSMYPSDPEISTSASDVDGDEPIAVPWHEWSRYVRCFPSPNFQPDLNPDGHINLLFADTWHSYIYGQRAGFLVVDPQASTSTGANETIPAVPNVTTEPTIPSFKIRLLDFNQAPIQRQIASASEGLKEIKKANNAANLELHAASFTYTPLPPSNSQPTIVTAPDLIEYPDLFHAPLISGTRLPYQIVTSEARFPGLIGLLLDDERVVGIQGDWTDHAAMPTTGMVALTM